MKILIQRLFFIILFKLGSFAGVHAYQQCQVFLTNTKNIEVAGSVSILRTENSRSEEAFFKNFSDKSHLPRNLSLDLLQKLSVLADPVGGRENLTAFRIEEKAIIKHDNAQKFLKESEKNLNLTWELRDVPPKGEQFLTVTAYGKTFQLATESKLPILGKLRIRKYYSQTESGQNLRPVFNNISVLEFKISNIGRFDETGKAFVLENGVFKPRIHISDSQLVQLIQLSKGRFESAENVERLITEIASLTHPNGQPFNKLETVKNMLDLLKFLNEQSPKLLETDTVIAYNRNSYTARDKDGVEYQFTVDNNVRVFAGNPRILCCSLDKYLAEKPLEILPKDHVFAELKSPVDAKWQFGTVYANLYSMFTREHFGSLNSGKYALSNKKISSIFEESSNKILEEKGTLLWLIRGSGFLPEPQNRKAIVEHGQIKIAIPFAFESKDYRLMVEYKTYITTNSQREAFVDKIQIVDQVGRKVDFKDGEFKDLLRSFRDLSEKDLAGVLVEGHPIIIKPKISATELKEYVEFFNDFYVNFSKAPKNPRDAEMLQKIQTVDQLAWYTKKMKMQNFVSYTWSRVHRLAAGAIIGATILWYNPFQGEKVVVPNTTNERYVIEIQDKAAGQTRYFDPKTQTYIEKDTWPSDYQVVPLTEVPTP